MKPKEIITEIRIPTPSAQTKSYYVKHVARESYDWSLGDVAVVLEMDGQTCNNVNIVLGAAAPTPYRAISAEKFLTGKIINAENAERTAVSALEKAQPLSRNEYKIPLFMTLIKDALLNLS